VARIIEHIRTAYSRMCNVTASPVSGIITMIAVRT
jgi:hypothetical protein